MTGIKKTAVWKTYLCKEGKTHSRLPFSCLLTCTHLDEHKCQDAFKSPLLGEIVRLLARNLPSDFLKLLKLFEFLSFALIISSDEWQSKAQFNLQSLGGNKIGYRAENIKFVSTDENLKNVTLHFIPSWKCTTMQSNASSLPIINNFHVMLLLCTSSYRSVR